MTHELPVVPPALDPTTLTRAARAAALARRELIRVRRGVLVASPNGPDAARARHAEVLAEVRGVLERLSTPFWFSHSTAALLWGCWSWRLPPEAHVTQLSHPHISERFDGALRRHRAALPPADRAELDGVPVVSLERAVVDCARTLCPDSGLVVADSALRLGASRAGLERIVAAAAGKRGIVQARSVLALADERSESPGETLVRYAAHRAGAPPPTPQLSVPTSAGTFRLDLAWPDVCVGVEFDGAIKYSDEFGDPVQRLLAEKRRHDALVDAGWWIVRVSWEELHDLEALGTKLLRARRARSISAS